MALLATSHTEAEEAIRAFHSTVNAFGLTVSYSKAKFLVTGHVYGVTEEDLLLIMTPGGRVEFASVFLYLASQISLERTVSRYGSAWKSVRCTCCFESLWCMRHAVFQNNTLSLTTKRLVYIPGMCFK